MPSGEVWMSVLYWGSLKGERAQGRAQVSEGGKSPSTPDTSKATPLTSLMMSLPDAWCSRAAEEGDKQERLEGARRSSRRMEEGM